MHVKFVYDSINNYLSKMWFGGHMRRVRVQGRSEGGLNLIVECQLYAHTSQT